MPILKKEKSTGPHHVTFPTYIGIVIHSSEYMEKKQEDIFNGYSASCHLLNTPVYTHYFDPLVSAVWMVKPFEPAQKPHWKQHFPVINTFKIAVYLSLHYSAAVQCVWSFTIR